MSQQTAAPNRPPSAELALSDQLLEHADTCLQLAAKAHEPGPRAWLRASALLQRQALETLLEALYAQRMPGVEHASLRAQLLVLPEILRSPAGLATRIGAAWGRLSSACHRGGGIGLQGVERLREPLGVLREWRGHGVWG
ncbi:MAG: hypothetical protein DWQ36_14525 [Acidobacteria bacterium]|nr:MAG: hypothetical protein DWQ30_03260 [Acidobacteriota bacterium]REK06107.1 MAG: hypothetical protein DWQ36_14525 [Acidobacteriota bacterium]